MGIFEIVGESLTALMVSKNEVLVVTEPSPTVIVMMVFPDWFAAGVTFTVRFAPEPPKTMFAFGATVGFEELPERVRFPAGVSASPTVNGIGPVEASSSRV